MPDAFGVPSPECAEDYQQFLLSIFDLIDQAREGEYLSDGIRLLIEAREKFILECEERFPGFASGRAIWKI